jgi:hypothetical protein
MLRKLTFCSITLSSTGREMKIIINCLTTWLLFIIFHIHHHISFLLLNPNHNQNLLSQSSSLLSSSLYHKQLLLHANPINADGNNYRGDITEDEAFLWFDEALIYVRGGSGMISSKHSCNIYLHIHQLRFT